MAVLLKTASVRVSFIQIMQVRVQNKGKSVWKSRYDGDVSDTKKKYERAAKMLETNKKNAAKKKHHHRTGSGGYLKAQLVLDKAEHDLQDKGIEPETINWPDRCWTWFFGAGGTLDPVTGKCIWTNNQMDIPVSKLKQYIEAA